MTEARTHTRREGKKGWKKGLPNVTVGVSPLTSPQTERSRVIEKMDQTRTDCNLTRMGFPGETPGFAGEISPLLSIFSG